MIADKRSNNEEEIEEIKLTGSMGEGLRNRAVSRQDLRDSGRIAGRRCKGRRRGRALTTSRSAGRISEFAEGARAGDSKGGGGGGETERVGVGWGRGVDLWY